MLGPSDVFVKVSKITLSADKKERKDCLDSMNTLVISLFVYTWRLDLLDNHVRYAQSNFLSTVIFNFDHVFFGICCYFLRTCVSHWVSVTQESLIWPQKRSKSYLFVTNQWFLCCNDSVRQTNSQEMAKNSKKYAWSKLKITKLWKQAYCTGCRRIHFKMQLPQ